MLLLECPWATCAVLWGSWNIPYEAFCSVHHNIIMTPRQPQQQRLPRNTTEPHLSVHVSDVHRGKKPIYVLGTFTYKAPRCLFLNESQRQYKIFLQCSQGRSCWSKNLAVKASLYSYLMLAQVTECKMKKGEWEFIFNSAALSSLSASFSSVFTVSFVFLMLNKS